VEKQITQSAEEKRTLHSKLVSHQILFPMVVVEKKSGFYLIANLHSITPTTHTQGAPVCFEL
jgi:hypothetical protein